MLVSASYSPDSTIAGTAPAIPKCRLHRLVDPTLTAQSMGGSLGPADTVWPGMCMSPGWPVASGEAVTPGTPATQ